MALDPVGTLSYNGVTFSVLHRSHVTATVVYDSSKRVTKYVTHRIEVDAWIQVDVITTNPELDEMRKLLTQPGAELKYDQKGYGSFHVNGTSPITDVDWGPKPQLLTWRPLGADNGCFVTWAVETSFPECEGARYQGIRELNYTIAFDIDEHGVTTRTITGHVEIALNRSKGNSRVVRPATIEGFQRMGGGKFTLSEDRTRLDFTFIDKQIVRALPGYATGADVTEDVQPAFIKGRISFFAWDIALSGTITLPPDRPRSEAWDTFLIILRSRLSKLEFKNGQLEATIAGTNIAGKKGQAFLRLIRWSEKIYGWSSSFEVRYHFNGATLSQILLASGMWQPIEGTSFALWKKALDNTAWHARGTARMGVKDGEELLVDLCLPPTVQPPTSPVLKNEPIKVTVPAQEPIKPPLNPEFTWRYYINNLRVIEDDRIARHKRLPANNNPPGTLQYFVVDPTTSNSQQFAKIVDAPDTLNARVEPPEVIQKLGKPSYLIVMEGEAERIGEDIPIPRLVKVGGIEVTQMSAQITKGFAGEIGGFPIRAAAWQIIYAMPDRGDGELPDLANPVFNLPGG